MLLFFKNPFFNAAYLDKFRFCCYDKCDSSNICTFQNLLTFFRTAISSKEIKVSEHKYSYWQFQFFRVTTHFEKNYAFWKKSAFIF